MVIRMMGIRWGDAVLQADRIPGYKAKEIYMDRGYMGHNYEEKEEKDTVKEGAVKEKE